MSVETLSFVMIVVTSINVVMAVVKEDFHSMAGWTVALLSFILHVMGE